MKLKSPAKRVFDEFKRAQATGDKSRIIATLQELGAIFDKELPELSLKQRKFCLALVGEANGNGTEACRLAGYKGSDLTLAVVAHENLSKPNIQECVRQLRAQAEKEASDKILSATEVLVGLTRFALADPAEVFEVDGSFSLQKAQERGVSRLIKALSFDKDTGKLTRVELHNAHAAHVDLGRYHKLFPTKIEISSKEVDETIEQAAREHGLPLPAGTTELESTM